MQYQPQDRDGDAASEVERSRLPVQWSRPLGFVGLDRRLGRREGGRVVAKSEEREAVGRRTGQWRRW